MPRKSSMSKAFAVAFIVLTLAVIAGIVTMIALYQNQIAKEKPTPRPTFPSTTTGPPPDMRLPRNLVPHSYRIVLKPHLYTRIIEVVNVTSPNQTMFFEGQSTVYFHCIQKTSTIFLNSKDLTVSDPEVKDRDTPEKEIHVTTMEYREDESNFLEIHLDDVLEAGGNYSLSLNFHGELTTYLDGLYMSTYLEGDLSHGGDTNTQRFLAATNMEPTNARRVFPCFDEPDMKAIFNVTIIHRQNTIALANAEQSGSQIIDDWKYTSFYPTPQMSTYLFAFTVSEFKATLSPKGRVDINTYARPEATAAGYAQYAANITGRILEFYEDFFEIKYQQQKLDQIALPDLNPAAMENWGLITYQEGGLLYEEGVSSLLHKEVIATLIAHELAHQWFGNMVTMKWWNDIWLSEGFATYMSYLALDQVEPTFKIKDTFVLSDLHAALEVDAFVSSHPLSPPQDDIQTTSEITEMFDTVTYSKGAIVLRMLADIVGESVFNKGIKMYLSAFRHENTDQNDLWENIQQAVHENGGHINVAQVMNTWTKQNGYPVININTTSGEIYQKHFLYNDSSESDQWWYVPIRVKSNTSEHSMVSLDTSNTETREEFISKNGEWILANVDCTGYYRVNYNPENWNSLLTQLETAPDQIPLMNRGQLIDDAFNLARAKLVDVTLALNLTLFLQNERAYLPWKSAVRNLEYFVLMFDRSEVYGPMQAYLREQVKNLYIYFRNCTDNSTVPKDHSLQHNQITAIEVACSNGLPECLAMATRMFALWMTNDTNLIHPNLRSVIYCQAIAAGGTKEWEFAWKKFQTSSDTSEKEQLSEALSCTKKIWLLNRYLEYTLDPEKIRLMDVASTINYIAKNVAGQALAWNFIRAHWEYVKQGDAALLIKGVTSRFSTPFELEELERFARVYDMGPATRAVYQALEQTQVNIQWVSEHKEIILDWFESHSFYE